MCFTYILCGILYSIKKFLRKQFEKMPQGGEGKHRSHLKNVYMEARKRNSIKQNKTQ